ncbi:MAG: hypothetical protein AAF547_03885 [Actinomycetota bacterium]
MTGSARTGSDPSAATDSQPAATRGVGMPPRPTMLPASRVRTPLWRRLTALFTLSFLSVLGGLLLAAALGTTALLILFVLERAIAT